MKTSNFLAILCFSSFLTSPLSAEDKKDKIGTINMQKLVNDYYKTDQTREEFKGYEEVVKAQSETRFEAIKALAMEARDFQKKGEDSALSREQKDDFFKQASAKNQEAQALANARQGWLNRKKSALTEKANVEFALLRAEIIAIVQKVGDEKGYDFILDRTGTSGAQVPILSYAKDATDLTGVLLEIINKDAPVKDADAGGSDKSE